MDDKRKNLSWKKKRMKRYLALLLTFALILSGISVVPGVDAYILAAQARTILDINKSERHIRGGMATKEKYLNQIKYDQPY